MACTKDRSKRLFSEYPETVQHIRGMTMAYMERHNQVAGIVDRNICAEYGLEVSRSKWKTKLRSRGNFRSRLMKW